MQVQWWGTMKWLDVVGRLKPYHMLKKLFELIALKGNGDEKTLDTSARARMQGLVKLSLPNILQYAFCSKFRSIPKMIRNSTRSSTKQAL